MPRDRSRGPGRELEDLLGDMPKHPTCRHACRCGCHYGRKKHAVACTSCTSCGKGHTGIATPFLEEHLRACHPDR